MINQKFIHSLSLCSRCITHEISSWINDKRGEIDPEVSQQLTQELKAIKLIPGNCIVCDNKLITENSVYNIIKIMEKNKVSKKVVDEFKKFFALEER